MTDCPYSFLTIDSDLDNPSSVSFAVLPLKNASFNQ